MYVDNVCEFDKNIVYNRHIPIPQHGKGLTLSNESLRFIPDDYQRVDSFGSITIPSYADLDKLDRWFDECVVVRCEPIGSRNELHLLRKHGVYLVDEFIWEVTKCLGATPQMFSDLLIMDILDFKDRSFLVYNSGVRGGAKTKKDKKKKMNPKIQGNGAYSMRDLGKSIGKVMKGVVLDVAKKGGDSVIPGLGRYTRTLADMGLTSASRFISGRGDYSVNTVRHNSLISGNMPVNATFGGKKDTLRLKHREYIRDIVAPSTQGFNVTSIAVNAANPILFPFGSSIASNYEEYYINGIVIEYNSMVSSLSSNPALGSIVLSAQYNVTESGWSSKFQMENSGDAVSCRPDHNMLFGFECKEQPDNGLYTASTTNTTPINLTNFANLYIGIMNTGAYAAGASLGELWVTYDVTLRRPRITPSPQGYLHYAATTGVGSYTTSGYSLDTGINLGIQGICDSFTFSGNTTSYVISSTLPVGFSFEVIMYLRGINQIPSNAPATGSEIGIVACNNFSNDSTSLVSGYTGTNTPGTGSSYLFKAYTTTSSQQQFTITSSSFPAVTPYTVDIFIVPLGTSGNTANF